MNEINQKVSHARRRLIVGKFFSVLVWAIFVSLFVALIGIAIPKIWHMEFLENAAQWDAWLYSWILGSLTIGMITTAIVTWFQRSTRMSAAVEVDRRFRLKERISSAMELTPDDAESPAGQALIEDAQVRASDLAIADEFQFKPRWTALLPLAPMAVIAILFLIPNAGKEVIAEEAPKFDKKRVQAQIEEFRKKVEEKRKQLDAKGLKDASAELKSLGKKFDKLMAETEKSPKETMVKLNDIKKQLENRRKELGDRKELSKNLNKLKDLGKGPAKKLSKALGEGDFDKAAEAIKEIADKLKNGKLDKDGAKALAKDLNKLAQALKEAKERREREIEDLKNQVEKAKQNGDLNKAAQLQEKLEEKQRQANQMKKLDNIADKLQKCADCMNQGKKPGDKGQQPGKQGKPGEQGDPQDAKQAMEDLKQAMKEAGESLEDIAQEMEDLQQIMEEMDALHDLEQVAEDCKDSCQGEGQADGQGQGKGDKPNWKDWARGKGQGQGLRERADDETGNFKAKVKADVTKGQTIVTGTADGANITGRSVSETRELVRATMDKKIDPTEDQKLNKKQMEHAKQYFQRLRDQ